MFSNGINEFIYFSSKLINRMLTSVSRNFYVI